MRKKLQLLDQGGWYLLLSISILGTVVFSVYPLIETIIDSLVNPSGEFVGFTNYKILFQDIEFRQSFINTVYMGVLALLINIPLSFMFANMINNIVRGRNFFKTVFLLPIIMSMVTVALMFKFVFAADPNSIANAFLGLFGIKPIAWFNDPNLSRQSVVMMNLWKNVGYNVILFFAGLQNVRKDYYEAAQIDGAGTFQQWVSITIPCMRNTFIFVYITMCINVLKRFSDVYAISGEFGEPAGSLHTLMLYIYRKSFSTRFSKDLGAASSASIILFIFIIMITILNFILTRDKDSKKKTVVSGGDK